MICVFFLKVVCLEKKEINRNMQKWHKILLEQKRKQQNKGFFNFDSINIGEKGIRISELLLVPLYTYSNRYL